MNSMNKFSVVTPIMVCLVLALTGCETSGGAGGQPTQKPAVYQRMNKVNDQTDKFTGTRSIIFHGGPRSTSMDSMSRFSISPRAIFYNGKNSPEYTIVVQFEDTSLTQFMKKFYDACRTSTWLIDGTRRELSHDMSLYSSDSYSRGTTNFAIYVKVPQQAMSAMARAGRVEFRLCASDHQMSATELQGLKQVYSMSAR